MVVVHVTFRLLLLLRFFLHDYHTHYDYLLAWWLGWLASWLPACLPARLAGWADVNEILVTHIPYINSRGRLLAFQKL